MGSRTGENWKLYRLSLSPFMDYLNSLSLGLLICKTMLGTMLTSRRLWQELNREGCEDISSVSVEGQSLSVSLYPQHLLSILQVVSDYFVAAC